jgi:hypothetical protein
MSFAFTSYGLPRARPGAIISVCRYDSANLEMPLVPLPNVRCLGIEYSEGASPGSANFRYEFNAITGVPGAPTRLEHVYSLDSTGHYVVKPDDRLVVLLHRPGGSYDFLFDGFVLIPEADLSADGEEVRFAALATPVREWDHPLPGAYMRDATDASVVSDIQTELRARFNPDGKPNMTPLEAEATVPGTSGSGLYATFLGPIDRPTGKDEDEDVYAINGNNIRFWTLGEAARYIIARGKRDTNDDPTDWVKIQDWDDIVPGLQAIVPFTEGGVVDLEDSSTWELKDIVVQDYDCTGDAWPEALQKLIEPYGFYICFDLRNEGGLPAWYLRVFRKDINDPLKYFSLQAVGATMEPAETNVGQMRLARDSKGIVNRIVVDTNPAIKEASFVLAPLFHVAAGDETTPSNYSRQRISALSPDDEDYHAYREFGVDEIGEGHWDVENEGWSIDPGDIGPALRLLSSDDREFVHRRRPGINQLVSVDSKGKPREAELWVCKASVYFGEVPGVWDGSVAAKWQKVISQEWSLLPDRLGIRINTDNVEAFGIGKPQSTTADTPFGDGKLNLLKGLANPNTNIPEYLFRLTCSIEHDQGGLDIVADRRSASPTRFTITRRYEAGDRFEWNTVTRWSNLNPTPGSGGSNINARIDREKAQDYADGQRRAHERAKFGGSVTIPRIITTFWIGDKIEGIAGRGVNLKTNAGGEAGESDTYPCIVGVSLSFDGRQSTTLQLNDHRAEPARRRTR